MDAHFHRGGRAAVVAYKGPQRVRSAGLAAAVFYIAVRELECAVAGRYKRLRRRAIAVIDNHLPALVESRIGELARASKRSALDDGRIVDTERNRWQYISNIKRE